MKALAITISLLLAVAPLTAQQIVRPQSPDFYVPYGVRDLRPVVLEEESTSAVELQPSEPDAAPNAPQPQRHPARPAGHRRRLGPPIGYPAPLIFPRVLAITGVVMIGLAVVAIAAGDQ